MKQMTKWMLGTLILAALFTGCGATGSGEMINLDTSLGEQNLLADFEDLTLEPESFWDGSDASGGFTSGSVTFNNSYNSEWGSWEGFAYSNMTDTKTAGFGNQYSAMTAENSETTTYAVAYYNAGAATPPTAAIDKGAALAGIYVTNTAYAYYSILDGDAFAKQFGGETGDDPDWFLLTIRGLSAAGESTGSVEFYLADYRFEDNDSDYIISEWTWVDLSSLGEVAGLEFELSSSDTGDWGMNTPAYFSLDNIAGQ